MIEPPTHDDLFGELPETPDPRPYNQLVGDLMRMWNSSKPETERKMEQYSLAQCEKLLRKRWIE